MTRRYFRGGSNPPVPLIGTYNGVGWGGVDGPDGPARTLDHYPLEDTTMDDRARLDMLNARIELAERALQRKRDSVTPIHYWFAGVKLTREHLAEYRKEQANIVESLWR